MPAENVSSRQGNQEHEEYAEILEAEEDGNGGIADIFSIHSESSGSLHPSPSKLKFDCRLLHVYMYIHKRWFLVVKENGSDMLNGMLRFSFLLSSFPKRRTKTILLRPITHRSCVSEVACG